LKGLHRDSVGSVQEIRPGAVNWMTHGTKFTLPGNYSEQAVYSVTEGLAIDGVSLKQHRLAVLTSGTSANISASGKARCIVIGGEPVGERHKLWNFVSQPALAH
jgi:hypothetical protein